VNFRLALETRPLKWECRLRQSMQDCNGCWSVHPPVTIERVGQDSAAPEHPSQAYPLSAIGSSFPNGMPMRQGAVVTVGTAQVQDLSSFRQQASRYLS
jgi:hypothetical protein